LSSKLSETTRDVQFRTKVLTRAEKWTSGSPWFQGRRDGRAQNAAAATIQNRFRSSHDRRLSPPAEAGGASDWAVALGNVGGEDDDNDENG
jgi:hypothetical protein